MIRPELPRGRVRVGLATIATAALSAPLLALPAHAAPSASPSAASATGVTWVDCRDGFECARVPAPLDHGDPDGDQIGISVIRLPAGAPEQRIGSLMLNPGGPGGSGVDFVRAVAKVLPLELRSRFDIVGFDPRGINLSTPLRCFDTFEQAITLLPPFPYPDTPAEERDLRVSDDELAAACARNGGAILDHMSTADVARDMDLLREAFGDEKVNYLGFSYGSVLGQHYANLFPSRVGALVIDGVIDPVAWTTGQGEEAGTTPIGTRIGSADGAARSLEEFFRLCDEAGAECAFSGDASGRYAALGERLRGHPVTITDPVTGGTFTITYNDLIAVTVGALYAPFIWPDLAFLLADLEQLLSPAELGHRVAALRSGLGLDGAAQEEYPNVVEGPPGVACSDSLNPASFSAWQSAADSAEARFGRFGRLWNWANSTCRSWPTSAGQDRYPGPWTAETSSPVLVVGNHFDPATPYHGAVAASELLPNSRLLSYAGWGHTATFAAGNFCVDSHVTAYLVTGALPAEGTVCEPEGSPFGPTSAAAAEVTAAALHAVALPQAVRRALHAR
ncbi:alpha/beta hydrolase [Geodermatophilus sp. YIM 151500]|uniref:alpha/beta hydrolase n=1 Tax=Geodermatophilus sp. YIM 151500 TaxID=2984531 RepID=UPI0021E4E7FD|nr:alpha/beta hydrolase [Geodermatophilus sp. YIM 151500]MCV2488383.1 alpha/beta hydrolase [Geodermatophilus sp. YIM 151500]